MAIYHLSLAAVNQSKVARFPGASKALLSVASRAAEPTPIRRLALMVICNMGGCSEGRASLMDAGVVAAVSGILLSSHDVAELEEWCVAANYALSRGSLRFAAWRVRPARTRPSAAWPRRGPLVASGARW
ncbi:U-box domain-containing protein 39-like [Hordeum vulgare]|nr:U-box domain-containing protein 39-like [Hordeum vulgare]